MYRDMTAIALAAGMKMLAFVYLIWVLGGIGFHDGACAEEERRWRVLGREVI